MLVPSQFGRLIEPLSGRVWERSEILERLRAKTLFLEERGVRRHDRVFLHYGNTLELFIDILASWHLGACVVLVDGRLTSSEAATLAQSAAPALSLWKEPPPESTARALADSGVRVALTTDGDVIPNGRARALPPSAYTLDDDALIFFTSGSTGEPKGVVHTHRSVRARWVSLHSALGIEPFRNTLCLLPTHFGHGLICNCLFPWVFGQDLHILPPFRADILAQLGTLIDRHEITFLSSVPTVWRLALKIAKPPERKSLIRVACGSAPLAGTLWRSVQEWTGVKKVINVYGITETGSWLAGTTVPIAAPEDGLIGEAWGGTLAILPTADTGQLLALSDPCKPNEEGHVWINTPALMRGYLGREDLTSQVVSQGWFSTGDLGVIDDRGYLYLRGRVREEINKSGQKVHPGDVDAVMERFAETIDVCTFAYADSLHGEDIGVAVVLQSPSEDVLMRLHQWTAKHLAAHKIPNRWYIVEQIPRTSRGKLNRSEVAEFCKGRIPVKASLSPSERGLKS